MKTKFSIITVYKSVLRQELFDICIGTKNKVRNDVGLQEIVELFQLYECTNAVLVKHGYSYFGQYTYSVRAKAGQKLEYVDISKIPQKAITPSEFMEEAEVYTGEALRDHIQNSGVLNYKPRNIVRSILAYAAQKENCKKLLWVSALKGSGKTTSFLQACDEIVQRGYASYNNIAYILINKNFSASAKKICKVVLKHLPKVRFLFIDDITYLIKLKEGVKEIYDVLADAYGINTFITGKDSFSFFIHYDSYPYSNHFFKMLFCKAIYLSYDEAKRTMDMSFDEYMQTGALYRSKSFRDEAGLKEYIMTALVDNIFNSVNKAEYILNDDLIHLRDVSKPKLAKAVLYVFYSVIFPYLRLQTASELSQMIELFERGAELYRAEAFDTIIEQSFGFDKSLRVDAQEYTAIKEALILLDILQKVENICLDEYKYLITDHCIANVLSQSITSFNNTQNLSPTEPQQMRIEKDSVIEFSVSAQIITKNDTYIRFMIIANIKYHFMPTPRVEVFYYRDENNREVDLVIRKTNYDEYEGTEVYSYNLFEIQMTNDPDTAASQTMWLSDISFLSFFENEFSDDTIRRIGILYMGEDKLLDVSNNTQLSEFKNQSEGIRLISIESFLNDPEKYLEIDGE